MVIPGWKSKEFPTCGNLPRRLCMLYTPVRVESDRFGLHMFPKPLVFTLSIPPLDILRDKEAEIPVQPLHVDSSLRSQLF